MTRPSWLHFTCRSWLLPIIALFLCKKGGQHYQYYSTVYWAEYSKETYTITLIVLYTAWNGSEVCFYILGPLFLIYFIQYTKYRNRLFHHHDNYKTIDFHHICPLVCQCYWAVSKHSSSIDIWTVDMQQ